MLPPLSLQKEFAERVAEVEGISALNDRAALTAEQLTQSLLAQVFGSQEQPQAHSEELAEVVL